MKKYWHWIRVAIAVAFISGALFLLYSQLKDVPPGEILAGVQNLPASGLFLALTLTVINYLILVGYDWAAIRYVQHPLKLGRIAFASFICYAMSHNFGWIVGGPASRYRMYSTAGLTTIEIVKLVAILAVAYWTGFFALAGVVFTIHPPELPPTIEVHNAIYPLPNISARPLGILFIAGVLGYLLATALWKKPIKWRGHEFRLPPFQLSTFQVTVAMFDIAVAGAVLWAVMPHELTSEMAVRFAGGEPANVHLWQHILVFMQCLSVYMMAMLVVITLHIPGGAGVLEAVVIAILAPKVTDESGEFHASPHLAALAGSLIVYRAIYYLLPLTLALIAFAGHEVWLLRRKEQEATEVSPAPAPSPELESSSTSEDKS